MINAHNIMFHYGKKYRAHLLLCFTILFTNCNRYATITNTQVQYIILNDTLKSDTAINAYIKPYADSLNKSMQQVIAYSAVDMPKAKPESLLGNFFCDALLYQSEKYFVQRADVCINNYGGLRLPAISKGNITVGKIYELMPFDNTLVLMKIKGDVLQQLFNHIAKEGGWPLAGASFVIQNNEAANIVVQNKNLDTTATYTLLLSDYMADGGDKLSMLKGIGYENSGVWIRDVLIDYLRQQQAAGKNIEPQLQQRITYAK